MSKNHCQYRCQNVVSGGGSCSNLLNSNCQSHCPLDGLISCSSTFGISVELPNLIWRSWMNGCFRKWREAFRPSVGMDITASLFVCLLCFQPHFRLLSHPQIMVTTKGSGAPTGYNSPYLQWYFQGKTIWSHLTREWELRHRYSRAKYKRTLCRCLNNSP